MRLMNGERARTIARWCACVGVLVVAGSSTALAQTNEIRICNEGNTGIWVAKVWNYKGWLPSFNSDNNAHKARGWNYVGVGRCEEVFHSGDIWSSIVYFSIAYQDRFGTVGLYEFTPDSGGLFSTNAFTRSDAVFCATREDPFAVDQSNREDAESWCGRGREWDGKWWVPMPFILQWVDPVRTLHEREYLYKFTVRPDANRRVWWPFPTSGGTARTGSRTAERRDDETLLPKIASAAVSAASSLGVEPTRQNWCLQKCNIISVYMPSSVLTDGGRPTNGNVLLIVDLKIAASSAELLGLHGDTVTIRSGGRTYALDAVRYGQAASVNVVRMLFVVPATATQFELVVKGQPPVRLAVTK